MLGHYAISSAAISSLAGAAAAPPAASAFRRTLNALGTRIASRQIQALVALALVIPGIDKWRF